MSQAQKDETPARCSFICPPELVVWSGCPTSVIKDNPASKALLDAIGFDTKNFAQNGIRLPDFGRAASAAAAGPALSAQLGAGQLTNSLTHLVSNA